MIYVLVPLLLLLAHWFGLFGGSKEGRQEREAAEVADKASKKANKIADG